VFDFHPRPEPKFFVVAFCAYAVLFHFHDSEVSSEQLEFITCFCDTFRRFHAATFDPLQWVHGFFVVGFFPEPRHQEHGSALGSVFTGAEGTTGAKAA
jgi:hypothetical protein